MAISGSSAMSSGAASTASGNCRHARARNHRGHSSAFQRGADKIVPVEPLAAHRKKQLARATVRESME
jgi:hypothetical protein